MTRLHALGSLAGIIILLGATSCLEREEVLRVETDGSVSVVHTIRGQGPDIDGGEAGIPAAGFTVSRTVTKPGTEDEETTLVASARFASVDGIPDRFEAPGEAHPAASFRFTSELRITDEPDGRHFHFTRIYIPREWARFDLHHRRAFSDRAKEILEREPGGELTDEERRIVLEAFAAYECGKWQEWLLDAVRVTIAGDAARLRASHAGRAAIEAHFAANASPEQLEALLAEEPAEIERASRQFERALDEGIADAVGGALPTGLDPAARGRLLDAIAGARRATHVTEDLEDESFVVRVRLPGRVIAHDADAIEDGFAVWRFDGKDLRDREQRIEITSVSP